MKEKIRQRNTNGLAAYARQRALHKQEQVDQAIGQLLAENKPINFNAVATRAGVTKAYLYNHPELRDRIETLRASQMNQITTRRTLSQRTEGSREVLLVAKDRRIKELEAENRQLKEELKVARGKWYEQMETNR
jgi:predicted nuclease with TOPRIM domain